MAYSYFTIVSELTEEETVGPSRSSTGDATNAARAPQSHQVLEFNRALQRSLRLQLSNLERAIAHNERARRAASQGAAAARSMWLPSHKAAQLLGKRVRPAVADPADLAYAPAYGGEDEGNGGVLRPPSPPLKDGQHPRLSEASAHVPPTAGALRRSALASMVPVKPPSARASTPWSKHEREQVPS